MPLIRTEGKLIFLRVHRLETGFGGEGDKIEGEVVGKISSQPTHAFGFTLRRNPDLPTHQAMLDLLRDAFANDWTLTVEYELDEGDRNGQVLRIELERPEEEADPRRRLLRRLIETQL